MPVPSTLATPLPPLPTSTSVREVDLLNTQEAVRRQLQKERDQMIKARNELEKVAKEKERKLKMEKEREKEREEQKKKEKEEREKRGTGEPGLEPRQQLPK